MAQNKKSKSAAKGKKPAPKTSSAAKKIKTAGPGSDWTLPPLGKTQLVVYVRDQATVLTYLEIAQEDVKAMKSRLQADSAGSSTVLRLYQTTAKGVEKLMKEMKVEPGEINRRLDLGEAGDRFILEVAQKTRSGKSTVFTRSALVETQKPGTYSVSGFVPAPATGSQLNNFKNIYSAPSLLRIRFPYFIGLFPLWRLPVWGVFKRDDLKIGDPTGWAEGPVEIWYQYDDSSDSYTETAYTNPAIQATPGTYVAYFGGGSWMILEISSFYVETTIIAQNTDNLNYTPPDGATIITSNSAENPDGTYTVYYSRNPTADPNSIPGLDLGSNLGTDRGTDMGTDKGTDKGTDMGTDKGTDVGTDKGTDVGTDKGTDVGTDKGTDVGTDVGTDKGTDVGTDVGTAQGTDQ
jgi:hypothetical protein